MIKPYIREIDIEKYLVKKVEAAGGTAEKFTSPGRRSVPDRIVSWPAGPYNGWARDPAQIVFVECKAPYEKPTQAQKRDHKRRQDMGFRVYVVDTYRAVDLFMEAEGK
jgi:hypothetical protein